MMRRRTPTIFLLIGCLAAAIHSDAAAQNDRYVEIASFRRQSPVYYEAFTVPTKGSGGLAIVAYKIPFDRLVFMRHHEGNPGEDFRAGFDVMIEIYQEGSLLDTKVLKQEAFAPDYDATVDPTEGFTGAVTFQLDPGRYGFRLVVTDQNTQRSAASLVRPVMVPDYAAGAIGKPIIAANVDEQGLFTSVELSNLGGDARFGERAFAIIPVTTGSDSTARAIEWSLRQLDPAKVAEERRERMERIRRRAREAEESVGIRVEEDRMPSAEGGVVVDSGLVTVEDLVPLQAAVPVDVLPEKVRLTEAEGHPDYYAAIIDLHGEKLQNGAYALDIRLAGSPERTETSRFDTNWPDMPFSLFDIDVAIQNMEFILGRDELKALKSGSKDEKIAKFNAFWAERDPTPDTAYNELMVEYYRRVDYAALEYRTGGGFMPNGLKSDRAKIYIVHGPPDEITRSFPDRGGVLETWKYNDGRTYTFEAVSSLDPFYMVDGS